MRRGGVIFVTAAYYQYSIGTRERIGDNSASAAAQQAVCAPSNRAQLKF
jgi:hypothetical protein